MLGRPRLGIVVVEWNGLDDVVVTLWRKWAARDGVVAAWRVGEDGVEQLGASRCLLVQTTEVVRLVDRADVALVEVASYEDQRMVADAVCELRVVDELVELADGGLAFAVGFWRDVDASDHA